MRFRASILGVIGVLWLLLSYPGQAQDPQPTEYQFKAALLFNFAKFVEWPSGAFPDPRSPIVFGILGENPFHDDLIRTLQDKTINNRSLVVREFNSVTEATNCQVLFISVSEKRRLPEILQTLRSSSALTVSELDRFIESGGMIYLFAENKKIHFQVSPDAAKSAGLKVSSKLLGLSTRPGR